jgi:hypothetical protein
MFWHGVVAKLGPSTERRSAMTKNTLNEGRDSTAELKAKQRLTLRKETLRDLSVPELRRAMGGGIAYSVSRGECFQ